MSLFAGEIHALVGGNGCGKSTALAVLCGGYKPQRGKCKGKVQTALLAQDTRAMFAHDTVEAELRQTARIHGQMERWEEVTEKLQIAPLLPKHPYDISVGERQRAALAKCLLTGAGVLLLDEPTKGMEPFPNTGWPACWQRPSVWGRLCVLLRMIWSLPPLWRIAVL